MNLVSIIIPVYFSHNKPNVLGACLKSLSAQTFPKENIEIIIVGDGCIVKEELCPSNIKCIVHNFANRKGVLKARNKGVKLAHGNFLAFLDADCVADQKWLERLTQKLDEKDIAGCSGKIIGFNDRDVYKDRVYSKEYILPCSGMGNIIFKRNVLSEIDLFDEKLCFGAEEADLCWRIYLKGYRIKYTPEAIVYHTSVRNIKDLFLYGAATRILTTKYKTLLRLSPLPELMRLAKYPGAEQKSKILSVLFSIAIPFIVVAGYLYRALLEILHLASKINPAKNLDNFLSKTPLVELTLTINSKKVAKPNHVIWWETEDGCVIKDLKQHTNYILDGVSSAMWTLIIKNNTIENIIEKLIDGYNVDQDVLLNDFNDFLNQLVSNKVLKLR